MKASVSPPTSPAASNEAQAIPIHPAAELLPVRQMSADEIAAILIHPAAELLPLMTDKELASLAADIKERGLLEPIVLYRDGSLLDGRNRLRACLLAGVDPRFVIWNGDDPYGYVRSKNLILRHLSTSQRAMFAARYAKAPVGNPNFSQHKCATLKEAAKWYAVSERQVSRARHIIEHGTPEIVAAVESDEMSLNEAERLIREPVDPVVANRPSMRRQEWLETALIALCAWFKAAGYTVPPNIRISLVPKNSSTRGYCCNVDLSSDKHHEIGIATVTDDGAEIIATLVHEMVHATVGLKAKHGPKFKKCALLVGLEGRMASTNASPRLLKWAKDFIDRHGPYPGGSLEKASPSPRPKRSSPLKIKYGEQVLQEILSAVDMARKTLPSLSPDEKADRYPLAAETLESLTAYVTELEPFAQAKEKSKAKTKRRQLEVLQ